MSTLNDLEKPLQDVFYLPMHAIKKESRTTTKIRAVFVASAKSSTGISLNDTAFCKSVVLVTVYLALFVWLHG